MPSPNSLIGQVFIGALVWHQFFVIILLLTRPEERKDHSIAMAVFFAANLLTSLPLLVGYFRPGNPWLDSVNMAFPFALLLGPAVYFYARALVSPNVIRLQRRDARHLLPFLVAIPGTAALLWFTAFDRTEPVAPPQPGALLAMVSVSLGLTALTLGVNSWYLSRVVRLLAQYRHRRFNHFSSLKGRSLNWFGWMIAVLSIIWVVNANIILDDIFFQMLAISNDVRAGIEVAWVCALSLMVLWQPAIFAPRETSLEGEPVLEPEPGEGLEKGLRYSRSGLDAERAQRIASKIERAMAEERLYRHQSITLRQLSEHTRIPENYISQVLNVDVGKNFYEYINHWRVRDACALLKQEQMSIIEIGEEVGFNSRSTFNAAFKKEVGVTPSEFRALAASQAPLP
ncbi:MAG: helix-turn-helix transcriptional regulator [Methylobacterium sp.]|nr:helix-turn-helix transcriptional regulator [Methylobacterium sp.]